MVSVYISVPLRFHTFLQRFNVHRAIGPMSRVFANGKRERVQSQVESYQRLKKRYLMPPCLTLGTIKVRIKSKVEQSRGKIGTLPYTSV